MAEVLGGGSQLHRVDNEDGDVAKDADSEVLGVDSQLHSDNNEDSAVAEDADSQVPGGEGNPGTEREAAVKWLWNGRPFERYTTSDKTVKIFTVSHSPKVGHVNTKWAHANDRPLLILERSLVLTAAQSAQGGSEADDFAPFEEAIPLVRDTGQHERVLQTVIGGLACDEAESAVGAVQEIIVEATVMEEAAVKEVAHSQEVEKAVSISHRVLGTVVAKD